MIVAEETYLTPDEIAQRLKIKPDTVMLWLRQRKLSGYKVGGLWRISQTDYERFMEEGYNADKPQKGD
jgi:excisionase family DNA binding protein